VQLLLIKTHQKNSHQKSQKPKTRRFIAEQHHHQQQQHSKKLCAVKMVDNSMHLPQVQVKKNNSMMNTLRNQASSHGSVSTNVVPDEGTVTLIRKPKHCIYASPGSKDPIGEDYTKKIVPTVRAYILKECTCGKAQEASNYEQAKKACKCSGLLDTFADRYLGWILYAHNGRTYVISCLRIVKKEKQREIFILTKPLMTLLFPMASIWSQRCPQVIEQAIKTTLESWDPESQTFGWLPTQLGMRNKKMVPAELTNSSWPDRFVVDSRHLLDKIRQRAKTMTVVSQPPPPLEAPATEPSKAKAANGEKSKRPRGKRVRKEQQKAAGTTSADDPLVKHANRTTHGAPVLMIHQTAEKAGLFPLATNTKSLPEEGWVPAPDAMERISSKTTMNFGAPIASMTTDDEEDSDMEDFAKENHHQPVDPPPAPPADSLVSGGGGGTSKRKGKKAAADSGVTSTKRAGAGKRLFERAKKKAASRKRAFDQGLAAAKRVKEIAQPVVAEEIAPDHPQPDSPTPSPAKKPRTNTHQRKEKRKGSPLEKEEAPKKPKGDARTLLEKVRGIIGTKPQGGILCEDSEPVKALKASLNAPQKDAPKDSLIVLLSRCADQLVEQQFGNDLDTLSEFVVFLEHLTETDYAKEIELATAFSDGIKTAFGKDNYSTIRMTALFLALHVYRPQPMTAIGSWWDQRSPAVSAAPGDDDDDDDDDDLLSELMETDETEKKSDKKMVIPVQAIVALLVAKLSTKGQIEVSKLHEMLQQKRFAPLVDCANGCEENVEQFVARCGADEELRKIAGFMGLFWVAMVPDVDDRDLSFPSS
jgi:hypothetical protein